jgi:DnaJ-class molecular chaperone
MSGAAFDPYAVLGVAPDVSDGELRRVYRELVKRHHPDHNGGSPESAARFAQIQRAYAAITQRRLGSEAATDSADPDMDARIAALERELAAKRAAQARQAQAPSQTRRPTPEELGQYTTDDSFTKIFDDAAEMLRRARRRA